MINAICEEIGLVGVIKDQLAAADNPKTDELHHEIEELEARSEELTSFTSGSDLR